VPSQSRDPFLIVERAHALLVRGPILFHAHPQRTPTSRRSANVFHTCAGLVRRYYQPDSVLARLWATGASTASDRSRHHPFAKRYKARSTNGPPPRHKKALFGGSRRSAAGRRSASQSRPSLNGSSRATPYWPISGHPVVPPRWWRRRSSSSASSPRTHVVLQHPRPPSRRSARAA
jgi:hypothetical protein